MARVRNDGGIQEFEALREDKQRRVLLEYANNGGRIFRACKATGVSFFSHHKWRQQDPDYLKAYEFADDIAIERILEVLKDEIINPHGKGDPVPNMLAAMFTVKAKRPEYRDNFNPLLVSGAGISVTITNYTVNQVVNNQAAVPTAAIQPANPAEPITIDVTPKLPDKG